MCFKCDHTQQLSYENFLFQESIYYQILNTSFLEFTIKTIVISIIKVQYCAENATERVRQCVPFAFRSRSICVPLLPERIPERVHITLVITPVIIGNSRKVPSINKRRFTLYFILHARLGMAELSE